MSTLRLRIHKDMGGQQASPQVYAKIRSIAKPGVRNKEQPIFEVLIPFSDKSEKGEAIHVTPGHYNVQVVLPSGEFLYENVVVKSDETKEVVLKPEDSSHEWLSWQQISGNVQPIRKAKKPRSSKSSARSRSSRASSGGMKAASHLSLDLDELVASIDITPEPEPEVRVQSPIQWLTQPHSTLSKGDRSGSWKFLSSLTGTSAAGLIHNLNGGKPPTQILPAAFDKQRGVYRVRSKPGPMRSVVVLQRRLAAERTYVAIPRRTSVELVSVPLPWKVVSANRRADIEIAVHEPSDASAFCSSTIAIDEDSVALLGFLSSGSLTAARQMAERGKERLYYKFENPFAAAAGAYALVGTAQHATERDWHQWVRNLNNYFGYIPDGAIQWGTLMMRMRRSSEDIAEAVNAFKTAYSRGLPFYSLGIKWLLEGLEWAGSDDPQAKEMADNVRPIAWRTNYQQPFTTLRIGG